jgi:hypothetical protein
VRAIPEIAATIIAVGVLVALVAAWRALAQMRRTTTRAAAMHRRIATSLPGLAAELRVFATRLDRIADNLGTIAAVTEHLADCGETAARAGREGWNGVRQKIRRAAIALTATAAGAVSVSREALHLAGIVRRPEPKRDDFDADALWLGHD